MFHAPRPASTATFDLRAFAKRLVVALIEAETDLTKKKQRIMVAYEHGHLTADEAEEWIVLGGMVHAEETAHHGGL